MSITIRTKGSGLHAGPAVEILDESGAPVQGVTAVDIRVRPDEAVTAELEIAMHDVSVVAEPRWFVVNPATGRMEQVRRIEFANGDAWGA